MELLLDVLQLSLQLSISVFVCLENVQVSLYGKPQGLFLCVRFAFLLNFLGKSMDPNGWGFE